MGNFEQFPSRAAGGLCNNPGWGVQDFCRPLGAARRAAWQETVRGAGSCGSVHASDLSVVSSLREHQAKAEIVLPHGTA